MRRALLLGGLAALTVAGAAYGATTTLTAKYVLHSKITPKRSGTTAHPVSISAAQLGWTVTTAPAGQRPPVVQGYHVYFQGVRANTNDFPACSSSTLNSTGPSSCRKGSQIGAGYFLAAFGASSNTKILGTCRADLLVFNGGGHTLLFYVYKGTEKTACPLPAPEFVIVVRLTNPHHGRDLAANFSVPNGLRHPAPGFDAAVTKSFLAIKGARTTVTRRIGGRKHREKVGLFETVFCPPNHQRLISATFTPEGAPTHGRISTTHVACT